MTARQFLAFQSAKSTSAKFRRYHLLIAVNEWLADQVRHLDTLIERVTLLAREQAAASTGLTAEQSKARQDLVDTLVELCGLGEGWAASVGNERLRTNLVVTPTGLAALGLRIEVVAPALLTGLREAADLGAHRSGLTNEVVDGLAGQIDRLVAATTVRDFRDERKSATQELSNALVELMTFLRDVLDPAMRSFQRREPRFYEEYRNSRRIDSRKTKADDKEEEQEEAQGQETTEPTQAPASAPASTPPAPARPAVTAMRAEGMVLDQNAEADAALDKVLGTTSDEEAEATERTVPTASPTPSAPVGGLSS
jgi:hypothetical protein